MTVQFARLLSLTINSGSVAMSKLFDVFAELHGMHNLLTKICYASLRAPRTTTGQQSLSALFGGQVETGATARDWGEEHEPLSLYLLKETYMRDSVTSRNAIIRRLSAVSGRIWRIDHSFKIAKKVYSGNRRPFKSTMSIMNEIGEIVVLLMLKSESMAEAYEQIEKLGVRCKPKVSLLFYYYTF